MYPKVSDTRNLQAGDLVFFGGRHSHKTVGHTGIAIQTDPSTGVFTFIHASCSKGITESHSSESYYRARYRKACRVFKDNSLPKIPIIARGLDLAAFTADRVSE